MRPINRQPFGFLDFFGLKSLGKNPEVMNDQVQPIVDMREWYLRTNAEQLRFLQQIVAGGVAPSSDPHIATGALVVPAGEWWYVHSATLVLFSQVGAAWVAPGIMTVRDSAPTQYYEALVSAPLTDQSGGPTSGAASYSAHSRPRCWLPPLTSIGASYYYLSTSGMTPGDTVNFNVHLSITRARA